MMSTKMRLELKCLTIFVKWCRLMDIFYTKIGLENRAKLWCLRGCYAFIKFMNKCSAVFSTNN